jgi:hypothetical protein
MKGDLVIVEREKRGERREEPPIEVRKLVQKTSLDGSDDVRRRRMVWSDVNQLGIGTSVTGQCEFDFEPWTIVRLAIDDR